MRTLRALRVLLGMLMFAPSAAFSDTDSSRVFLLATEPAGLSVAATLDMYVHVDEKLSNYLLAQNLQTFSSFQTVKVLASSAKEVPFQAIHSEALSESEFAITYSIEADIHENAVSHNLKARARGAIYDARNQEMLSTFSIATPESVALPKDKSACNHECVSEALSELGDNLAREMSFVLAQKISIIKEDRVVTDTADAAAIKNRLSASTARKPVRKTIITDSGDFDVDVARSINIEVYFDFDSSTLTPRATEQLKPLGEALSSAEIGSGRYLIIGHTDAKGSEAYNQTLSEKRAAAVRNYLVERFPVQPSALVSLGLGEAQLKRPAQPYAGINRRVEVSLLLEEQAKSKSHSIGLSTYTLRFKLFSISDVLKLTKALEAKHVSELDLLQSSSTARIYSLETQLTAMELEEALRMTLLDLGFSLDRIRIVTAGDTLTVENL